MFPVIGMTVKRLRCAALMSINSALPNALRMRCHFRLHRQSLGMKGGGEGERQLPLGRTIKAEFPPS